MFQRHLPEIEGVFLYELFLERGVVPVLPGARQASVFDPCASRGEPALQRIVRALAEQAGFELEPLPMEGRLAECCSYGGQVALANPPYARHMVQDRIAGGPQPFIAYCSNCRDVFAKAGKPTWHILDLLFGLNPPERLPGTFSGRRRQRLDLKRRLLEDFWNETPEPEAPAMELILSPALKQKLSDAYLLEADLAVVVEHCERTGRKVQDPETGSFHGHLMLGPMTYWAEYRPAHGGAFQLLNAYGHRMAIEEA
jgi:hypothetical protein